MTEPLRKGNFQRLEPLCQALREGSYRKLDPLPRTSQNAVRARNDFEDEIRRSFSRLTSENVFHTRNEFEDEISRSLYRINKVTQPDSIKSEMTFWSRYDAVANHKGNTDHWTKLKQRAVQRKSLSNPDDIGKPITLDALQGNMPGTYMYARPRNSPARDSLRNSFNDRAKEGFRYWLIDRPKPTKFGKYGIGSYKTVLGVGNAPRT